MTATFRRVLLDVQLPGLSGPDVLRAPRSRPDTAGLPVVFLTAGPVEDDARLLGLRASGVLHEPFDPDTVARRLAALL